MLETNIYSQLNPNRVQRMKKDLAMGQPYWSRLSTAFALNLELIRITRDFNICSVMDEIAALERSTSRPSSTKAPERFGGAIMGRFWHKHYSTAQHMGHNLRMHWTGPYAEKIGLFGQTLNEIYPDREKSITPDEARGMLVRLHQTLLEGLERRKTAARMTGEWIIYYQHEGRNYYLDIAWHSEQANEQALYDRLNESCAWEFPFAFQ